MADKKIKVFILTTCTADFLAREAGKIYSVSDIAADSLFKTGKARSLTAEEESLPVEPDPDVRVGEGRVETQPAKPLTSDKSDGEKPAKPGKNAG